MSLMDDFLETTSYDRKADWRNLPELGEEDDRDDHEIRDASLFAVPDDAQHKGLLVSLHLDIGAAEALYVRDGEDPADMHITLCYCGNVDELGDIAVAKAVAAVAELVERSSALRGSTLGIGRFDASPSSDGKDVIIARVDIPGLIDFRQRVAAVLTEAGVPPKANFVYFPHITLIYIPEGEPSPVDEVPTVPLSFPSVFVSVADAEAEIPFGLTS